MEVVDFIIHSVNELLRREFRQTLGSQGVHIIDPFVGTGSFITRLLQSGLIGPDELERKYKHEVHANEIALLAYYIAAINIEAVYHTLSCGDYLPFEGICLTDTFQLFEQDNDLVSDLMADNGSRLTRQRKLPIRVIVSNPPYSVGQSSANDNASNIVYPKLGSRVRETYAARSRATLKTALYDSYVRAFRWASDRIGDAGIVAFVSNAGWIDGGAADGMRRCLADEFSSIYVFHLRGNARSSGEQRRKEKDNIFGQGSRTPVAITVLVKNPSATQPCKIRFYDIGDYLSREQKLAAIAHFGSVEGIARAGKWQTIRPDEHGDWLGQRDKIFDQFLLSGSKDKTGEPVLFCDYSGGIKTNRDAWCYNPSRASVSTNMRATIAFYESEVRRFARANGHLSKQEREALVTEFIDTNPTRISWDHAQKVGVARGRIVPYEDAHLTVSLYRPFTKQWLYLDGFYNNRVYRMPRIFPMGQPVAINRVIMVKQRPPEGGSFALMVNCVPELQPDGGTQCFPRWFYDISQPDRDDELVLEQREVGPALERRDAITDEGLAHFLTAYPGEVITKDDLFYYVYGLLHSEEYRTRFADNLSKQLPRIPAVKSAAAFRAFAKAGRKLADLHCDYEQAEPYPVTIAQGDLRLAHIPDPVSFFRVEKMKFGGKRPNLDRTTILYNHNITVTGIPLEAYNYVVNGKSAIEWVMERQCVKVDPASGIVSDANAFANETMNDPAYPFKLLCRIITVSLETLKIVRSLPPLDIADQTTPGLSSGESEQEGAVPAAAN